MARFGPSAACLVAIVAACSGGDPDDDAVELCAASSMVGAVDPTAEIAFASARGGAMNLWTMRSDGTAVRQLTDSTADDALPVWSPDGRAIAYAESNDPEFEGDTDICVASVDGSVANLSETDDATEFAPTWSPDGTRIAFLKEDSGASQIFTMSAAGTDLQQITQLKTGANWPAWSPDGGTILFSSFDEADRVEKLWVIPAEGGTARALPNQSGGATEAAWSPDGTEIAFVSSRDGNPDSPDPVGFNEEIYVMDANGDNARRLTDQPGNDHWPPAWSPDGSQLAFTADGTENVGDIMVMTIGGEPEVLAGDPAWDAFVSWRRVPDLGT